MEFKDRVANKPNRVKLTYEDSGASSYATVELADEPIEEGTPLNAKNMNNLLNKENDDYIVEQRTVGIWTYRKWASGVAECFGKQTVVLSVNKDWAGAIFYSENTSPIEYPFVFVENPVFQFVGYAFRGEGLLFSVHNVDKDQKKYTPSVFAYSHVIYENRTVEIHWMVKGKWK